MDEDPASNDDPTSHDDYVPLSKSLENIPKIKEQHMQDLPLPNTLLEEFHGSTGPSTTLGKNDEAWGSLVNSQPIDILQKVSADGDEIREFDVSQFKEKIQGLQIKVSELSNLHQHVQIENGLLQ